MYCFAIIGIVPTWLVTAPAITITGVVFVLIVPLRVLFGRMSLVAIHHKSLSTLCPLLALFAMSLPRRILFLVLPLHPTSTRTTRTCRMNKMKETHDTPNQGTASDTK